MAADNISSRSIADNHITCLLGTIPANSGAFTALRSLLQSADLTYLTVTNGGHKTLTVRLYTPTVALRVANSASSTGYVKIPTSSALPFFDIPVHNVLDNVYLKSDTAATVTDCVAMILITDNP